MPLRQLSSSVIVAAVAAVVTVVVVTVVVVEALAFGRPGARPDPTPGSKKTRPK